MNTYNWLKRHRFEVNLVNAAVIAFLVMACLKTGDESYAAWAVFYLLGASCLAYGLIED